MKSEMAHPDDNSSGNDLKEAYLGMYREIFAIHCYFCKKAVGSEKMLNHILLHTRENSRSFPDEKCKEIAKCQICNQTFSYNSRLKLHMTNHSEERPFKCDTCGKDFKSKPHLKNHSFIHAMDRPFKCDVCGKDFKSRNHLRQHIAIHRENPQWTS